MTTLHMRTGHTDVVRADMDRDFGPFLYRKGTIVTSNSTEQPTGWTGWIAFAAFLLMISGTVTAIMGFLAIINNNWTQWNNNGAPSARRTPGAGGTSPSA